LIQDEEKRRAECVNLTKERGERRRGRWVPQKKRRKASLL